jgi:hypothetical protein
MKKGDTVAIIQKCLYRGMVYEKYIFNNNFVQDRNVIWFMDLKHPFKFFIYKKQIVFMVSCKTVLWEKKNN